MSVCLLSFNRNIFLKGSVAVARFGIHLFTKLRRPRKLCIFSIMLGRLNLFITSIYFAKGRIPCAVKSWPKNCILLLVVLYMHLSWFSCTLFCLRMSRTWASLLLCYSSLLLNTTISSMKFTVPSHVMSKFSMIFWNISCAHDIPNIKRLYRYNLLVVIKVVICLDCGVISIWWKAIFTSNFEKYLAFLNCGSIWSIVGNGWFSLIMALFALLMSIQIRISAMA